MKKNKFWVIFIIIVISFISCEINLKDTILNKKNILAETKLERNNRNIIINKIFETTLKKKDLELESLQISVKTWGKWKKIIKVDNKNGDILCYKIIDRNFTIDYFFQDEIVLIKIQEKQNNQIEWRQQRGNTIYELNGMQDTQEFIMTIQQVKFLYEKLLGEQEQNRYSNNVTLGEPVLFNNFSDYERYFVYRNEEFIRNVYTYKSDNINITLEQALDLCAEFLEREDPDLVMQRIMKEEKEGYVGYTFNYREIGDKNCRQIIENKIGTLGVEAYDSLQYEVYMYEDIIDNIETEEGHTAVTATFHVFLRDKLLVLES